MTTMVRSMLGLPAVFVLAMAWGGTAQAMGLGFYLEQGGEDYSYDGGGSENRTVGSIGFVLDTAVHTPHLVHYRLQLGTIANVSNERDYSYDFAGTTLINTLGFRIISNDRVRFWAGPQLIFTRYSDFNYNDPFLGDVDVNGDLESVGLGGVLGLNLHFRRAFSLGWEVGFRNTSYSGTVDGWNFDGDSTGGFFNMSFLWHLVP